MLTTWEQLHSNWRFLEPQNPNRKGGIYVTRYDFTLFNTRVDQSGPISYMGLNLRRELLVIA